VSIPLAVPVRIGRLRFTEREYVAVKVHSADGRTGHAYALTRGFAVAAAIETQLAPRLLEGSREPLEQIVSVSSEAVSASLPPGVAARAISLIDIALWDLKGQQADQPLWRLLGGQSAKVDASLITGYPDTEAPTLVAERSAKAFTAGWTVVKIARGTDRTAMTTLVEAIARAAPATGRLAVDGAWTWKHATDVIADVDGWQCPLAWIEDPMPAQLFGEYAQLRSQALFPVAVGDEVTDANLLVQHIERETIDVLRVDATLIGGVSGTLGLLTRAREAGLPVAFHVYPELHAHLAAATGSGRVELFHEEMQDPTPTLLTQRLDHSPGTVFASSKPGLGITFNDELLDRRRIATPPTKKAPRPA
jgi:L-alanine-DL-glutamate epimerase-like enolase superfamily enzyme